MGLLPTEWNLYNQSFCALMALCLVVQYTTRADPDPEVEKLKTKPFLQFQRLYLVIYLLAFFADWLQGPYVYALYDYYGYDTRQIAVLFIVGFMSSMVFGTMAGALADKYGRRLMCIAFSIIYIISCLTKFYNDFWILFIGRVTGGLATSLIFTVFEAWMVSEHNELKFPPELIGDTFGLAYFGNGMVAIAAGVVAEGAAGEWGYVAPFGLAIVPLALCGMLVWWGWRENYGDAKLDAITGLGNAYEVIRSDPRVLLLGVAQSAFEGSMYTFVFMWTPAIATAETKATLPYGTIFAVFMVCCALGSSLFSYALRKGIDIMVVPRYIHGLAAFSNLLVVMFVEDKMIVFGAFCLFEVMCGVFFPCYGTLRSKVIPEENRAAVMNFFRIPLNAFVVAVLIKVKFMPVEMVFSITTAAHTLAFFAYSGFAARSK